MVEFHKERYDRLTRDVNRQPPRDTARSDETSYRRDWADWPVTSRDTTDWRTRVTQRVRDQCEEMARQASLTNQIRRRHAAYFRDAEQSLAVGIDLKRYHHAI